jgi:hypothetical protein
MIDVKRSSQAWAAAYGEANASVLPITMTVRLMTGCGFPRFSGFTNRLEAIGFPKADLRGVCKTGLTGSNVWAKTRYPTVRRSPIRGSGSGASQG